MMTERTASLVRPPLVRDLSGYAFCIPQVTIPGCLGPDWEVHSGEAYLHRIAYDSTEEAYALMTDGELVEVHNISAWALSAGRRALAMRQSRGGLWLGYGNYGQTSGSTRYFIAEPWTPGTYLSACSGSNLLGTGWQSIPFTAVFGPEIAHCTGIGGSGELLLSFPNQPSDSWEVHLNVTADHTDNQIEHHLRLTGNGFETIEANLFVWQSARMFFLHPAILDNATTLALSASYTDRDQTGTVPTITVQMSLFPRGIYW